MRMETHSLLLVFEYGDIVEMNKFYSLAGAALIIAALMGSATAAIFSLTQTIDDPTATQFAGDQFGAAVAIGGNKLLIGAPGDSTTGFGRGQAHLYDASTGALLRTFNDPAVTSVLGSVVERNQFGDSVAIDGNNLVISASNDSTNGFGAGRAYQFDATTGNLLNTFNDPTPSGSGGFGNSIAINSNNVLIGDQNDDTGGTSGGQVHQFDATTGALLRTFNDPTPTAGGRFGVSVAVDGNNVLIGNENFDTLGTTGQVYQFDATTGALLRTFSDPTPPPSLALGGDSFGKTVAVSGNLILIGDEDDDTNGLNNGQVHLFDATTGALLQTFISPGGPLASNLNFGISVDIDGNNILIGELPTSNIAKSYLFDALTGNLLDVLSYTISTASAFNITVALDGGNALIGFPEENTNGFVVGRAFLFTADDVPVSVVPLPAALPLFGSGLAVMGFFGWRRKRRRTT